MPESVPVPFDPTHLGPFFRFTDGTVALIANTSTQIVPYNPYRVALFICPLTISPIIRPTVPATALAGLTLTANTIGVNFTLQQHGTLVQERWSGFLAGGGNVYFLEVLYNPP